MTPQRVAILVVIATLGLLILLLLFYGRPQRAKQEPLPANFDRGDPDAVLEGPRLHKILVWGVASSIFITGFLVVYFVAEPFRQVHYTKKFLGHSVDRGRVQFAPDAAKHETGANCASCHGPDGGGGFAATDTAWPAPPLNNVFHRFTRPEIQRIIEMGRPGTPMPPWHITFGGPLNDQKIDDVLNYLETLQVESDEKYELPKSTTGGDKVFAQKCAVCHGANARGQAMGAPLPTFFAPDLTTEFYRLGVKVTRDNLTRELKIKLDRDPSADEVNTALAETPQAEIMKAGEEAAENTILRGRPNTPMPAWQNRLLPEHIEAVVSYLRSIQRMPT